MGVDQKSMKFGNEELILKTNREKEVGTRQAVLAEDILIPAKSEMVVAIKLDQGSNGMIGVVEPVPTPTNNGILLGRTLISAKTTTIPARLLNTKDFDQKLRKGTIVGHCEEIQSVTEALNNQGITPEIPTVESKDFSKFVDDMVQNLEPEEAAAAKNLLRQFRKVFSCGDNDLGRTSLVQHRINTGDHPPIKQAPRRIPWAKQDEVDKLLKDMKTQGNIEPSNSPCTVPIVLVKKKDGSTIFCVDNRKLNDGTKKDTYPLPRIDDTLDTMDGAKWFSTLDLKSGYWQVDIHPDDKEKTAFSTGNGLWHFNVMPFGLCNAPATFERLMDSVLQGLHWKTCLVYLDDVIIFSKTLQEHLQHLGEVFEKLLGTGLKLSPNKCQLFTRESKFLGHIISSRGVSTDLEKTAAV